MFAGPRGRLSSTERRLRGAGNRGPLAKRRAVARDRSGLTVGVSEVAEHLGSSDMRAFGGSGRCMTSQRLLNTLEVQTRSKGRRWARKTPVSEVAEHLGSSDDAHRGECVRAGHVSEVAEHLGSSDGVTLPHPASRSRLARQPTSRDDDARSLAACLLADQGLLDSLQVETPVALPAIREAALSQEQRSALQASTCPHRPS